MNFIAEHAIACRVGRVVDLRARHSQETNSEVRETLEAEISRERRDLALLLFEEEKPERDGSDWFYVRRDEHGTLNLYLRRLCLPVHSAYVEHLLGELKITVPPKGLAVVSPAFAMDAIEEAVSQVNHDLAVYSDLRRRLAFFHRIAESLTTKSEDEKACA